MKALGILERDDKPDFVGKCEIKHTFDKYDKSMQPVPDTRYIPEMTNEGYVLITGDWAQRNNRGKNEAISRLYREHNAIGFWLPKSFSGLRKKSAAPLDHDFKFKQAAFLLGWWPKVKYVAATAKPKDLFDVLESGKIKRRD